MAGTEVRRMGEKDLPALLAMAERFVGEAPTFAEWGFDAGRCKQNLEALLDEEVGTGWVACKDGELIAALLVGRFDAFFSHKSYVTDMGWYVLPQYRGSLVMYRLVKEYLIWALALPGSPAIRLELGCGIDDEKAKRFLAGLGFAPVGTIMEWRVHG